MKQLLQDNKSIIGKLLRTHIVMAIFGVMVYIPFSSDNVTLRIVMYACGVLAVLLYLFLIDVDMWYLGAEHRLKVDAGREKKFAAKGILIALIAEIPTIVLGIIYAVISMLYTYYQAYPAGPGLGAARVIIWTVVMLWNGMYNGIQVMIFGSPTIALFHLLIPILPLICVPFFLQINPTIYLYTSHVVETNVSTS
ncbi:MAG: hypothetical protein MJ236_00005, partial [Clostridia bacterium]|nr:hypothetical protein [Clostridia bacterium]